MNAEIPPYVILGCGYVGTRLAQSLLADGARVRVCARRVALLEPLREAGAEVTYLDGARPHQFGPALLGLDRPVVVYSIPGVPDLPQGEAVRRAATAALKMHARAFIYLGSSAVYGRSEEHVTSEWVNEETPVASSDPDATLRLADEAAIQSVAQAGLRVIVLRLAAIYGPAIAPGQPARGVRQRLRSKQYKLWDGGRYFFSRIVIDDLVRVIRASAARAPIGATYVVGDDYPCPQGEYGRWLASHLELPEPPTADSHQSRSAGNAIRGRRLSNARLKSELGLTLLYPTYKEGELYLDACEKGTPLPALSLLAEAAAAAADANPAPPAGVESPANPFANAPVSPPASPPSALEANAPAIPSVAVSSLASSSFDTSSSLYASPSMTARPAVAASAPGAASAPASAAVAASAPASVPVVASAPVSVPVAASAPASALVVVSAPASVPGVASVPVSPPVAVSAPAASPAAAAKAGSDEPPAASSDARPAPAQGLSWPHAVVGEDLGVSAGLLPVGAILQTLPPGQRAESGPLYLVLKGHPRAEWGGQTVQLGPQALVPPGVPVHNDTAEPVLLLSLPPRRPPTS